MPQWTTRASNPASSKSYRNEYGPSDLLRFKKELHLLRLGACETTDACVVYWPRRGVLATGDGVSTVGYPYLGAPIADEGLTADGAWRNACHPAWNAAFERALTERLQDLKSTHGTLWAATVPYPLGSYDNAKFRPRVDCINPLVRKVVSAVGGIRVLDLAEIQCPKGECLRTFEGHSIRPDGVHYDLEGAKAIARAAVEQLQ